MDLEQIRQALATVTALTPEQLTELREAIDAEFDRIDADQETPITADVVTTLNDLATGAETVRAEEGRRADEAAQMAAEAQQAKDRMRSLRAPAEEPPTDPTAAEGEAEGEGEERPTDPTAEDEGEGGTQAPGPQGGGDQLPIAASAGGASGTRGDPRGMVRKMAAKGRAAPSPTQVLDRPTGRAGATVVASGGVNCTVRGKGYFGPNTPITDEDTLAEVMSETLLAMAGRKDHTEHVIASATWDLPEDRQLGTNYEENTRRIEAVCGFRAPKYRRGADGTFNMVATGGTCLPVNVDYSVPTWSTADRPLRDGLPSFQASRGGVQFVTPPDIGTTTLDTAGAAGAGVATGIWTAATDANPAGATKPVWTVQCGAVVTALVDAIPTRVQMGNMFSRFAPEQVAANNQQAIATAAREAEENLLVKMYSASKQIPLAQYLGATRDTLAGVEIAVRMFRYSHRIPSNVSFTAVYPEWVQGVFRSDIARELAHDTNGRDPLAITVAEIEAWLAIRGVDNVIWTLDGLKAGTYGTGGTAIPTQQWPVATAGQKPQWPGQTSDGAFVIAGLLFVEGTFQFLDGGRLDLGVVRDSLLDATNDYETFVEPFEGIAFRGLEVYQLQHTVLPTGGSGGSVATSGYHE